MITFVNGDIFTSNAEALVNAVNCVGVMGKGIALRFRQTFPDNFRAYAAACQRQDVQPGRMFVCDRGPVPNPRYVVNFPTKRHWRDKSRLEDIESGLIALVQEIESRRIASIALPALGSGLGGLDWADVRRRIERTLETVDATILVYAPQPGPGQRA